MSEDRTPLLSSRKVVKALKRAGFVRRNKSKGSHQSYVRTTNERQFTVTVPVGKKEIPRGTLESIIGQSGLTAAEFLSFVR